MDEHLLGVKINDQKAHLQKVLEEVGIANAELSKTFGLLEATKIEHSRVKESLASMREELSVTQAILQEKQRAADTVLADAEKSAKATLDSAAKELEVARITAEIVTDEAQEKVSRLSEEAERIESFLESGTAQAATLTADIGSLELERENLTTTLKSLRETIAATVQIDEITRANNAEKLNELLKEIKEAKEKLKATRGETAALFENLDRREKALKVAEHDIAVLQNRLRILIMEKVNKHGRHLESK